MQRDPAADRDLTLDASGTVLGVIDTPTSYAAHERLSQWTWHNLVRQADNVLILEECEDDREYLAKFAQIWIQSTLLPHQLHEWPQDIPSHSMLDELTRRCTKHANFEAYYQNAWQDATSRSSTALVQRDHAHPSAERDRCDCINSGLVCYALILGTTGCSCRKLCQRSRRLLPWCNCPARRHFIVAGWLKSGSFPFYMRDVLSVEYTSTRLLSREVSTELTHAS